MSANRRGFISSTGLGALVAAMTPVTIATAQTVAAPSPAAPFRTRAVLNPRDYGATGDGTTGDEVAPDETVWMRW